METLMMEVYYISWQIFIAVFLLIMVYALFVKIDRSLKEIDDEYDQGI
ncbi:hypothetical protein JYT74_01225 [Crocinitomix catalasitica]|nr:hypothetical protein [Crocinitomix catalasitica]